jgi:AraC-like DNA-binding protein
MKRCLLHKFLLIVLLISAICISANAAESNPSANYNKAAEELHKSNYNDALHYFVIFLQQEENSTAPDKDKLIVAYLGVGSIYSIFSDYDQAISFFIKGREIAQEVHNYEKEFKLVNNIIGCYCDSNNPEKANAYNEMLPHFSHINIGERLYWYFFNKGYIARCKGSDAKLVEYMNKVLSVIYKYHQPEDRKIYPYSEIFLAYERQGNLKMALTFLDKYYGLAKKYFYSSDSNKKYLLIDCFKGYMRLYTKLGDKDKSLYFQDQYFRYSDSLLNIRSFNQTRNEYQSFEDQKTGMKIDTLSKTNSRQRKTIAIVVVCLVIAVIIAFIIYRQRQRLHKANIALYKKNEELLEAETRYKQSMKRGQNMLAEVPEKADKDEEAAHSYDELLEKINSVMEDEAVFCNPDFSLVILAKMINSNTNYVSQAINTAYGKNFRTFIYDYRVKVAMRRLLDDAHFGNYSIMGIGESVGYKSSSNFIAAFKKVTGMTPSLYKKIAQEERN